jgi:hypothetical protein
VPEETHVRRDRFQAAPGGRSGCARDPGSRMRSATGVTEVSCDRKLATPLQYQAPPCLFGLQTSRSGGVYARSRRLAGCATPTGFAGQAPRSAKTNHELTFNPDHPMGADLHSAGGSPPPPANDPLHAVFRGASGLSPDLGLAVCHYSAAWVVSGAWSGIGSEKPTVCPVTRLSPWQA